MKKLFLLLPVLLVMLMTGCLKDDQNPKTIILMGTESDVVTIEGLKMDSLLGFISDSSAMNQMVVDLSTGSTPPDIQGSYIFVPREFYAGNVDQPLPTDDTLFFRFGGQQAMCQEPENVHLHAGDALIEGTDTLVITADTTIQIFNTWYYYPHGQHNKLVPCTIYGDVREKGNVYKLKSNQGYVMGRGNNFTVYFTIEYDCAEEGTNVEYKLNRGYVLTGVMSSEGIDHAVLACVNISVEGASQTDGSSIPEKDMIYVYRVKTDKPDQFGMAIRYPWEKH